MLISQQAIWSAPVCLWPWGSSCFTTDITHCVGVYVAAAVYESVCRRDNQGKVAEVEQEVCVCVRMHLFRFMHA